MGRAGLEGSSLFTLNAVSGGDRLGLTYLIDIGGNNFLNRAVGLYAALVQPNAAFAQLRQHFQIVTDHD
jgi:hypothetical protein